MSQSLSWIDPSAFSEALDRAGFDTSGPVGPNVSKVRVSGIGFVAHTAGPRVAATTMPYPTVGGGAAVGAQAGLSTPSVSIPSGSATAPSVAQPAEPAGTTAGSPPELRLDSSRLDKRLESYMEWVETCTDCRGLFIVDEEGLVLMERESDPNLVALSAYFLNLKDRIPDSLGTRSEGSLAIDLDDDRVLHVVQADTRLGPHALGFTVQSPLHRDTTQAFQETLSTVFAQA